MYNHNVACDQHGCNKDPSSKAGPTGHPIVNHYVHNGHWHLSEVGLTRLR